MNITDYHLEFQSLADRSQTNRIIIHHSASEDVSAAEIHQWHLAQSWSGIGYHFVIRQFGTIERGRPLDKIGAHAGWEVNSDSIGICLTGNFVNAEPTKEQIAALQSLIKYLEEYYNKKLPLLRHSDVVATACPGEKLPWPLPQAAGQPEDWKLQIVKRALAEKLITGEHDPDAPAEKWFVLAVALNLLDRLK